MTLDLRSTDCLDLNGMPSLQDGSIDLTVTSPPYDGLRKYQGYTFDFEGIAKELYRVTKPGGVVVWVVGDATVKGSETGTSFRQALRFMDLGFKLHDTMVYAKANPAPQFKVGRYMQSFEYMFVLSKGACVSCNYLMQDTLHPGARNSSAAMRLPDGKIGILTKGHERVKAAKVRTNVWFYFVGGGITTRDKGAFKHPAIFPEQLAADHILSWSNPGDLVLDPMCGSGTTCKMALLHGRRAIGMDISAEYIEIARERCAKVVEN